MYDSLKTILPTFRAIFIVVLLFFGTSLASTQGMKYPYVDTRTQTIAGELVVILPEIGKWELRLNDRIILREDLAPMPEVLKHIKNSVPPFDEVLVLHQVSGTYCNGGAVRFLGLKRNGSYELTPETGDCFASKPTVKEGKGFLRVSVRGGYGNNPLPEEPYLPGGSWLYRNGKVYKLKPANR